MTAIRERLFDLGLLAFPQSFRAAHGTEMREVARERLAELTVLDALFEALDAVAAGTRMRFEHVGARGPAVIAAGTAMVATLFAIQSGSLSGRDPSGRLEFNAEDPAGSFTLTVLNGRPVAATLNNVPLPPGRLVASPDTIRIMKADGEVELAIAFDRDAGSISWEPRAPVASIRR